MISIISMFVIRWFVLFTGNKNLYSQSYGFSSSHVLMWELNNKKRLSAEELIPSNCGAWENSWESPGLQGDQTNPILKETNSEYSLEGLMLKLKLQYFGHLMRRADSLKKTLTLGEIEASQKRTEDEIVGWHHWLDGLSFSKLWDMGKNREAWRSAVHGSQAAGDDWATEQQR